jgi:predicted GIY-YIG superfamily endonuclease
MHDVYYLVSESDPTLRYIGSTADLRERLTDHNTGGTHSTTDGRPWKLKSYTAFESKTKALAFERYLKSGSGRAFAKKRLW